MDPGIVLPTNETVDIIEVHPPAADADVRRWADAIEAVPIEADKLDSQPDKEVSPSRTLKALGVDERVDSFTASTHSIASSLGDGFTPEPFIGHISDVDDAAKARLTAHIFLLARTQPVGVQGDIQYIIDLMNADGKLVLIRNHGLDQSDFSISCVHFPRMTPIGIRRANGEIVIAPETFSANGRIEHADSILLISYPPSVVLAGVKALPPFPPKNDLLSRPVSPRSSTISTPISPFTKLIEDPKALLTGSRVKATKDIVSGTAIQVQSGTPGTIMSLDDENSRKDFVCVKFDWRADGKSDVVNLAPDALVKQVKSDLPLDAAVSDVPIMTPSAKPRDKGRCCSCGL